MTIKKLFIAISCCALLTGCKAPQIGYFQDIQSGQGEILLNPQSIKIQPGDKLSILVSSKNPELAYLYNLPIVGHYQASVSNASPTFSQIASYVVDENGDINFPILGKMHISNLTRSEVAQYVKNQLVSTNQIKDATVTVDFLDLYYSVMGEVRSPGRFVIDKDRVTLIDALSRAGDLTIFGKRENVLIMRQENGRQVAYHVDLANAQQLYSSPAFYLRQNDLVYVEPNAKKARESTAVGNTFTQPTFWVSIASLLISLAILIKK